MVQFESGKFSNIVDALSIHHAIAKVKYLDTWNFSPKCTPSKPSSRGKDFENLLNTIADIGFLLAQCTGWKRQNFKCYRCAKFSPCHCKCKTPAHMKLSTQMPSLNIFELRQRFRKSAKYLWRYRILPAQNTGWKWQNFICCGCAKFSRCHCKIKIPGYMKHFTQKPSINIFELRQRFRKSVEYLWR